MARETKVDRTLRFSISSSPYAGCAGSTASAAASDEEKAVRTSDLGFNPLSDGKVIRIPVPPMTEERRRDVCKHLNKVLEEHRTAVRNVRRDGNDALKKLAKDKKISEDEEKRALEEIQKMTDEEIRRMEELSHKKEAEVMQV